MTITDGGGLSTTSSVSVTVSQTLTGIAVTPAVPTLASHAREQFTATPGFDQFGNAMGLGSTTWTATAGSIDTSGLFTAPYASASVTVTATSGAVSGTTVGDRDQHWLRRWQPRRSHAGPVTGTTTALLGPGRGRRRRVEPDLYLGGDQHARARPIALIPTTAQHGEEHHGHLLPGGRYTFQVTITDDGGLSTTSSVNVTVNQTLTSIAVARQRPR